MSIHRSLASEPAKFLVAGALSYLVNQVALVMLYEYALGAAMRSVDTPFGSVNVALLIASAIAVEISIVARFALNDSWTFRDRRDRPFRQRFVQSNVSSLGSPAISLLAVNILTPAYHVNYLAANTVGVIIGLAWNWFFSTRMIWRPRVAAELPLAPSEP